MRGAGEVCTEHLEHSCNSMFTPGKALYSRLAPSGPMNRMRCLSTGHHGVVCCWQGPVFDTDARRAQGPVLRWIDRLLKAPRLGISSGAVPAVPKDAVGRAALLNLLRSNLEMFSVYVDRCYDRDACIATASFQVRSAL